ncbi:SUKH-4 family immunity protein [Streptomyces nogalater]|uniref:SUKH-4 family immunity protein n=1 Tax=Streptomyces nogalater TaxID=38314 RepID=A0ABW0WQK4_STRNO
MSGSGDLKVENVEFPGEPSFGSFRVPTETVDGVFTPVRPLQHVQIGKRSFVWFGSSGATGRLMVDSGSGSVFETHDASTVTFVNESLGKFIECLEAFSSVVLDGAENRDPADEADEDEGERMARRLEERIRMIDPRAYEEDTFWYDIRWDVSLGDW